MKIGLPQSKTLLAIGLLATTAGTVAFASLVGAEPPGYLPDPAIAAAENATINEETVTVEQVQEADGVTWTLVSYTSSDGPCLDVEAQDSSGESAKIGGCGAPDGPFRIGVGTVYLNSSPHTAAYGRAPAGAEKMRLALADGSTKSVGLANRTYLQPLGQGQMDVSRVDALDNRGRVIASIARE
jgi:hypothetical protein